MSAKIYGTANGTWEVEDGFSPMRDTVGKWSASLKCKCKRGQWSAISANFTKGTYISLIYPDVEEYFENLRVDAVRITEIKGGYYEINVDLLGYWEGESEDPNEVRYNRNTDLTEIPMYKHPLCVSEAGVAIPTIVAGYNGTAVKFPSDDASYTIVDIVTQKPVGWLTDTNHKKWWDFIIEQGNRTYLVPQTTWTMSRTTGAKLGASDYAKFGKIDASPPGNPTGNTGKTWLYSAVTEDIANIGMNSYTKTWTEIDNSEVNQIVYEGDVAP